VVEAEGVAVTEVPVVALKPVAGAQEYVLAPLAVSIEDLPEQMVGFGEIVTVGRGLTVTVVVAVVEQPFAVTITLYVPLVVAVNEEAVWPLSKVVPLYHW
jgi:hypothetical protein